MGGDLLDNEVSATTQINHVHRPFFLDNDGTPNTWLMLLELFFATTRYNPISKAQHLTALLPTEILQNLGPKIIAIVKF